MNRGEKKEKYFASLAEKNHASFFCFFKVVARFLPRKTWCHFSVSHAHTRPYLFISKWAFCFASHISVVSHHHKVLISSFLLQSQKKMRFSNTHKTLFIEWYCFICVATYYKPSHLIGRASKLVQSFLGCFLWAKLFSALPAGLLIRAEWVWWIACLRFISHHFRVMFSGKKIINCICTLIFPLFRR